MCETCGCGDPEIVPIEVQESLLADNDRQAAHNRQHFLAEGVVTINLMGSPGSGKTALLEATARALGERRRLAAVSGDLATERDADRLRRAGISSRAITTGSACHLDARLVHRALHHMDLGGVDYFFIENVGNLVCPAIYDLGQVTNVVAMSITEGEDKPLKYPVMFRKADLVVLTKTDLAPHLPGLDMAAFHDHLAQVMPDPVCFEVSATAGVGVETWTDWLEGLRAKRGDVEAAAHEHRHHVHSHHHAHA